MKKVSALSILLILLISIALAGGPRLSPLKRGMKTPGPMSENFKKRRLTAAQLARIKQFIHKRGRFDRHKNHGTPMLVKKGGGIGGGLVGTGGRGGQMRAAGTTAPTGALVLYDSTGTYGYVGDLYARQLSNLLSHFNIAATLQPVEQYQSGQIATYAETFYLGVLYGNPLPTSFTNDVMTSTQPVCWCGYNLWQIAWTADWSGYNSAFISKFGFEFQYMDNPTYPTVTYKGQTLYQDVYSGGQAKVAIDNPNIATAIATSNGSDGVTTIPYAVHGANLWYFGDNPMQDASTWLTADRSLVFQDALHDIVQSGITENHQALIRIEDVHAWSDPNQLRAIADLLYSEGVPFAVCVIPEYVDPLGVWNYGTPVDQTINYQPALVSALQYMVSKGGEIIMHGVTHQYSNVANWDNGVSGADYEFFRMVQDPVSGIVQPYGPVFEDSTAWVHDRIQSGLSILSQAGLTATGWNTPHYLASPTDYAEFKNNFQFSMCRGKTFTIDDQGYLYWAEQETAYPIVDDIGMTRLPENLGYVTTPAIGGVTGALPADLVARAVKSKVVRDGYASCFFHWFLDTSMLKDLVEGLKANGFTFQTPHIAAQAYVNQ